VCERRESQDQERERRPPGPATFSKSLTIYVIYSGCYTAKGFALDGGIFTVAQSDALMYMEENGVMGQSMRINNARKLSLRAEQRGQRSLATTLTSERRLLFFFLSLSASSTQWPSGDESERFANGSLELQIKNNAVTRQK
jgi:hypothetical protein